jgi:hypothetical protein
MTKVEEIQTLIAALESGYLKGRPWMAWSEKALLESSFVQPWLIDLYDAKDTKEALIALYHGWQKLGPDSSPLDQSSLYLGFLYLRYRAGELTMRELLSLSGEHTDGRNRYPDCEAFYLLLNEYEGREGRRLSEPSTFEERVGSLFLSYASLAKDQFASLTGAG